MQIVNIHLNHQHQNWDKIIQQNKIIINFFHLLNADYEDSLDF